MSMTPKVRAEARRVLPFLVAAVVGIFLAVASRTLDWSGSTVLVVGAALVAVLALVGTPLVLLSRKFDADLAFQTRQHELAQAALERERRRLQVAMRVAQNRQAALATAGMELGFTNAQVRAAAVAAGMEPRLANAQVRPAALAAAGMQLGLANAQVRAADLARTLAGNMNATVVPTISPSELVAKNPAEVSVSNIVDPAATRNPEPQPQVEWEPDGQERDVFLAGIARRA